MAPMFPGDVNGNSAAMDRPKKVRMVSDQLVCHPIIVLIFFTWMILLLLCCPMAHGLCIVVSLRQLCRHGLGRS